MIWSASSDTVRTFQYILICSCHKRTVTGSTSKWRMPHHILWTNLSLSLVLHVYNHTPECHCQFIITRNIKAVSEYNANCIWMHWFQRKLNYDFECSGPGLTLSIQMTYFYMDPFSGCLFSGKIILGKTFEESKRKTNRLSWNKMMWRCKK